MNKNGRFLTLNSIISRGNKTKLNPLSKVLKLPAAALIGRFDDNESDATSGCPAPAGWSVYCRLTVLTLLIHKLHTNIINNYIRYTVSTTDYNQNKNIKIDFS